MRISNPFFIGIFIIVLIALNIYVIPQQRKTQLQIEKKAIWKIPILSDFDGVITPYSLIESIYLGPVFQLKSIDKKTGKTIKLKDFPDEIGAAHKVAYLEDAIYVIFASSKIYKLAPKTLDIIWKTDWALNIYDWESITIEQAKDLILVSYFNPYLSFHAFIDKTTGQFHYEKKITNNSKVYYDIPTIFSPQEKDNWARYYHFKNQNFIFDKTTEELLFIDADYLMNLNDSLKLISFKARGDRYYRQVNRRYNSLNSFVTREESIHLTHGVPQIYEKSIASIQTSPKTIVFRFEKVDDLKYSNTYPHKIDYTFLEKGKSRISLSLQNINFNTHYCLSDNYFATVRIDNSNVNHNERYKEIVIIDLNKLDFKESFYFPFEQRLRQLLCDEDQLYAFVQGENGENYCLAVPLD